MNLYNSVKEEVFNEQYSVEINGNNVPCYKARVSAMPYNTIWPGYQRPIEQTELCSYVSFSSDESVEFRVRPLLKKINENSDIVIRPQSKKVKYRVVDGEIVFELYETGSYSLEIDGLANVLILKIQERR